MKIHQRGTRADLGVIQQCFQEQQFEIPQWRPHYRERADCFYRRTVAGGRTPLILDCGANIGAAALWFQARYPDAHIVAIEPAGDNFALLRRICAGPAWDLRQAAVGNHEGTARLTDPGEGEWGYRTTEAVGGYEVAVVTVAGVLAGKSAEKYAPFLLKVEHRGRRKGALRRGRRRPGLLPGARRRAARLAITWQRHRIRLLPVPCRNAT